MARTTGSSRGRQGGGGGARKRIRKNQVLSINSRNRVGQPHRQPHGTYSPSSSASLVWLEPPHRRAAPNVEASMDVASLWRQFLCYSFAVIESSSGRPALPIRVLYLQLLRAHTAVALDADFKRLSWKRMTHPSAVHCYQPPATLLLPSQTSGRSCYWKRLISSAMSAHLPASLGLEQRDPAGFSG